MVGGMVADAMTLDAELSAYEGQMERLVTAYRTRVSRVCKALHLTPPQLCALETLSRLERSKMSPLAEELTLSMGAASTLIDRLVTRGLVVRDTDATDRRAVYVSLSPAGNQLLEDARTARRDLLRQVFQHLSPALREQLLVSLDALASAWERLPADDGAAEFGVCTEF
jgi:DNA-binding MarR family transcriptional regulator